MQKEIPICYGLAIVLSFQEYQMCFFFFLGLQRETDSSTTAGLEMDAISERNIQPLLGYDWIAGLNNAKNIYIISTQWKIFPVLICINGIYHSFHVGAFWEPEGYRLISL